MRRRPRARACTAAVLALSACAVAGGLTTGARQVASAQTAAVPPAAAACELVVVRHGETEWNKALRVQGATDIPLNAKGRLQAERCAAALARQYSGTSAPGVVYTSMLGRASHTAEAIAVALTAAAGKEGRPKANLRSDPRLNEWSMGVLEGMTKDEAAKLHPEDWAVFSQWCSPKVSAEDAAQVIRDGESMDAVRQRAVAFLEEACRESVTSGRPVIAVTHGGVLGQLLRHAEGDDKDAPERPRAANACISRFLVQPGMRWKLMSWCETDHLDGDSAPMVANYDKQPSEQPR